MATSLNQKNQFNGYTSLCDAIKKGDKETTRHLLLNNTPVNPVNKFKLNTPLHWAVLKFDDAKMIEMLLEKGAKIFIKNQYKQTPLYLAVSSNKENAVEALLNKGASQGENFSELIEKASKNGNLKIVKILFEHGIQVDKSININSAVNIAAKHGHVCILKFLILHHDIQKTEKWIPRDLIFRKGPRFQKCQELLLKNGYKVSPEYKKNFGLVYTAVQNGYVTIVHQFLELGIDVNVCHKRTGLTFLHLACLIKNADIVKLLIEHKANLSQEVCNAEDQPQKYKPIKEIEVMPGRTALYIAVQNSDTTITKLLLLNGANINDEPDLINIAINNKHKEMLEILWLFGADISGANYLGITPLHYAIVDYQHFYIRGISKWEMEDLSNDDEDKYSIVEFLLNKGAYVNAQTNDRKLTPLHVAVEIGFANIVKLLLNYNANVTLVNSNNYTPFHVAVMNRHEIIADIFLEHGIDFNIKNNLGSTPLHVACATGNEVIVDKLLKNNVNVNCSDVDEKTPLHFACRTKKIKIIKQLLNHQANINVKDKHHQTPLHILSRKDPLFKTDSLEFDELAEICENFLQLNADINAKDSEGRTPLFIACLFGNETIVRILLKHKANINCPDAFGRTPFYVANGFNLRNIRVLNMLIENNANTSYVDECGNNSLHVAAMINNLNIMEIINKLDIDINDKNNEKNTALHIATKNGDQQMIERLIRCGADINIKNSDGSTVLHLAVNSITSIQDDIVDQQYDDDDDYECDEYQSRINMYKRIIKIFQKHALKLKMAYFYVNAEILELVYNDMKSDIYKYETDKVDVFRFETECVQELNKMKNTSISNITFYNLLTSDIHDIAKYANNQEINQALKSSDYDQKFPLYIDIIRSRFQQGIARNKLLKTIKIYHLLAPYTFYHLPYGCVEEIFRYFSIKDLNMFIKVIKRQNT